jgi:hypothetical protein
MREPPSLPSSDIGPIIARVQKIGGTVAFGTQIASNAEAHMEIRQRIEKIARLCGQRSCKLGN